MEQMDNNYCKSLWELSRQEAWDELFLCLNVDANATIELGSLKIPDQSNDLWLEDHKATLNSLEIILGFILFCDQIFLYAFAFVFAAICIEIYTLSAGWQASKVLQEFQDDLIQAKMQKEFEI